MPGACTFERLADLAGVLERAVGWPVDVIVLDRADPLVVRDAVRGVPILSGDDRATLEWTLAVDREAEDWAEFLTSFLDERAASRARPT